MIDAAPTLHKAICRCGQLTAECTGAPVRVSVCHCLECKRRSGSAFSAQVRFPADQVTLGGQSTVWQFTGDSGGTGSFHFCPVCGATLWYEIDRMPGVIAVALGNFENPYFVSPRVSVWEERKHDWIEIRGDGIEHHD